jgi:hypothetical protein
MVLLLQSSKQCYELHERIWILLSCNCHMFRPTIARSVMRSKLRIALDFKVKLPNPNPCFGQTLFATGNPIHITDI